MFFLQKLIILGTFLGLTLAIECPCILQNSTNYPGSYSWNCLSRGLESIPGDCWSRQSENVTDVILSNNRISLVSNVDFFPLVDVKYLYLDTNVISFFDPTALIGSPELQILNLEHNTNLQLPKYSIAFEYQMVELNLLGSHIHELPYIFNCTKLQVLDARSCSLRTLSRPTFGDLESDHFLLLLVGNDITDVAADILLPIPAGATINVDPYFIIWAANETEAEEVKNKNWLINIDVTNNLKVCGSSDEFPVETDMC